MGVRRFLLIALPLLAALAAFAIVNAGGVAHEANAQTPSTAGVALDMDPTNGSGPCNPIDDTRSVNAGDTFEIAFCLRDALNPPCCYNIEVLHDLTLDQCVPVDCPEGVGCLDTNPDANVGKTAWTTPDLGTGCDCSIGGELPPQCDLETDPMAWPGKDFVFIQCICQTATLPVGEGVSSPLAMVTFKNVKPGEDTFSMGRVALYDDHIQPIADCDAGQCPGGVVHSAAAASLTPTVEGTPPAGTPGAGETPRANPTIPGTGPAATAAAATAVAQGTSIAAIDQEATTTSAAAATKAAAASKTPAGKATAKTGAANQQRNGGSSGPNAILIAGIVVVAAIVAGGAGWFGYRRFRATR